MTFLRFGLALKEKSGTGMIDDEKNDYNVVNTVQGFLNFFLSFLCEMTYFKAKWWYERKMVITFYLGSEPRQASLSRTLTQWQPDLSKMFSKFTTVTDVNTWKEAIIIWSSAVGKVAFDINFIYPGLVL